MDVTAMCLQPRRCRIHGPGAAGTSGIALARARRSYRPSRRTRRDCPGVRWPLGGRRHFPECADWHRAQTRPEGEGFLPGMWPGGRVPSRRNLRAVGRRVRLGIDLERVLLIEQARVEPLIVHEIGVLPTTTQGSAPLWLPRPTADNRQRAMTRTVVSSQATATAVTLPSVARSSNLTFAS